MPHLSFKIQVSTFIHFKVIAFFIFVAEFKILLEKNIRTSNAKRCGSPNYGFCMQMIYCKRTVYAEFFCSFDKRLIFLYH